MNELEIQRLKEAKERLAKSMPGIIEKAKKLQDLSGDEPTLRSGILDEVELQRNKKYDDKE